MSSSGENKPTRPGAVMKSSAKPPAWQESIARMTVPARTRPSAAANSVSVIDPSTSTIVSSTPSSSARSPGGAGCTLPWPTVEDHHQVFGRGLGREPLDAAEHRRARRLPVGEHGLHRRGLQPRRPHGLGAVPFVRDTPVELFAALSRDPVPPLRPRRPGLPEGLEAAVLRALSREPGARFGSVRALGAALLPYATAEARSRWAATFTASALRAPTVPAPRPAAPTVMLPPGGARRS
ncbi:MAG: hypothetical protein R3A52_28445 [Polyangiales bacterium]